MARINLNNKNDPFYSTGLYPIELIIKLGAVISVAAALYFFPSSIVQERSLHHAQLSFLLLAIWMCSLSLIDYYLRSDFIKYTEWLGGVILGSVFLHFWGYINGPLFFIYGFWLIALSFSSLKLRYFLLLGLVPVILTIIEFYWLGSQGLAVNDLTSIINIIARLAFLVSLTLYSYDLSLIIKSEIEKKRKLLIIQKERVRFLSDISHELKTPLTVLQGNLSLSLNKFDPESQRDLKHSIKRLTNLASDLLELARAESGTLIIKRDQIMAAEIFAEITSEAKALAQAKKINLTWELKANPRLYADLGKLAKLAINLISNAVKYTPEGGRVKVKTWADEQSFYFSVTDTGMGIPKAELPHIFERFYRARLVRGKKIEGTGLGLAICKWIVEAHAGKIFVKSREGQGSEFTVILPRDVATGPP